MQGNGRHPPSRLRESLILWLSVILALLLQVSVWPKPLHFLQTSWLPILLIYWVLTRPDRINIGTGFCIGLLWDFAVGSLLGVHALVLSLLAYGVASQAAVLRSVTIMQQVVLITLLMLATDGIIFCTEGMVAKASFSPQLLWGGVINGISWPGLSYLLRKLRGQ